jgi:hypothetical protein
MSNDKIDLGDVKFTGKIKTQTSKQSQQKNLIRAFVMPASKLAETAKKNAELLREFEAAAEDELRHRKTAKTVPKDKQKSLPLTRERFED